MDCISPMSLPKPNGYGSIDRHVVPCGNCPACLSKARSAWSFRLRQELKKAESAFFITLTYDEDNSPGELVKKDVQDFMKRLRKRVNVLEDKVCDRVKMPLNRLKKAKLKYYFVGEYGSETKRPHYHAILFNLPWDRVDMIEKSWPFGFSSVGDVNDASINYVTKYVINRKDETEKKNLSRLYHAEWVNLT